MTGLYLPGAAWKPISYRADAGLYPGPPLGWVLHVQAGNGALFNYFNGLASPNRKFSTAWVGKDGSSEQYTELNRKPWSQAGGNSAYWGFETEGFPGDPLTSAQINTLAIWHNFTGTHDVLANTPGVSGVIIHSAGGTAWGGHSCPGTLRAGQRLDVIARAQTLRGVAPTPTKPAPTPTKPAPTLTGGIRVNVLDFSHVTTASTSWVRGPGVIPLQRLLSIRADGLGGPATRATLVTYQRNHSLNPDGVFGIITASSMLAGR